MTRDEIESLLPDAANSLLRVWAAFMRRGTYTKGYPKGSSGIMGGGIGCWDDLEEEWGTETARATNTVMCDIKPNEYVVISNFYCSKGWRYTKEEADSIIAAVASFQAKAYARGLL